MSPIATRAYRRSWSAPDPRLYARMRRIGGTLYARHEDGELGIIFANARTSEAAP